MDEQEIIQETQEPDLSSIILKRIHTRLWKHNQNYLGIWCGPTGSGKSLSALSVCEKLDPDFDVNRVVFSSEGFMRLLRDQAMKRGDFILWDEAGVGMSAREFWNISNRAMNYYLQAFRALNTGVMFTLPTMSMLDINVKRLAHGYFETQKILRSANQVEVKYFDLQTNPLYGKVYCKYPRTVVNGRVVVVKRLRIKKPSVKLVHAYEKRKMEWLDNLASDTLMKIQGREPGEVKDAKPDINVYVSKVLEKKDELLKTRSGQPTIPISTIQALFDITSTQARLVKAKVDLILCGSIDANLDLNYNRGEKNPKISGK